MKIVFLDKRLFCRPEEAIDFSLLEKSGDLVCYDDLPDAEIVEKAIDADIVITIKKKLSADIISQLKNTQLICKSGTGVNNIDLNAAKVKGIAVTNFPGYATMMTAQLTMALLLSLANNIVAYRDAVRNDEWQASQFLYPTMQLDTKTLGIFGFGHIGKQVAKLARAFNMRVLICTQYPNDDSELEFVDQGALLKQSDFVSMHNILNDSNKGMIDRDVFQQMKPSSYLINTSRAALICKSALYEALSHNHIAGAAIDGYWQEPPEANDPLLTLGNCIITPHMGCASKETRQALLNNIAERITQFSAGKEIHRVV